MKDMVVEITLTISVEGYNSEKEIGDDIIHHVIDSTGINATDRELIVKSKAVCFIVDEVK